MFLKNILRQNCSIVFSKNSNKNKSNIKGAKRLMEQMIEVPFGVFQVLSPDTKILILTTMDFKDLIELCTSSKTFNDFCHKYNNRIWKDKIIQDFKVSYNWFKAENNYIQIYKDIYQASQYLDKYKEESILRLIEFEAENYFGVKWLIESWNIDPFYKKRYYHNNGAQFAIKKNYINIMLLLFDYGFELKMEDIDIAIYSNHPEMLKLLLNNINNYRQEIENTNSPIQWASKNGHTEIVKILLSDGRIDPSISYNIAISTASKYGHINVVKLLLNDPRVDPSDNDNEAIIISSENDHLGIVELLLNDERVDPSDNDNEAIYSASENNYINIVDLLLDDDRVINKLDEYEISIFEKAIEDN